MLPDPVDVVDHAVDFLVLHVPAIGGHLDRLPLQEEARGPAAGETPRDAVEDPLPDLRVVPGQLRKIGG